MSVVIILILASLGVAVAFLGSFIWAVGRGQYEDTLTPAMRVLHDDASAKNHLTKTGEQPAPFPVLNQTPGRDKRENQ